MRTWPDMIDPPISDGYTVSPVDQAIRTDMDSGTSRSRRITKARRDNINAVINVDDTQMQAFRVWHGDEAWSGLGDSDNMGTWTRTALNRTANDLVGPLSVLCDKLSETGATDVHQATLIGDTSINQEGLTVEFMATLYANRNYARVVLLDRSGVEHYAVVNLSNGTVSSTSGATCVMTDRGGGWWRVHLTADTGIGSSDVTATLALMLDATTTSYNGNTGKYLGVCEVMGRVGNPTFLRTDADGNALGAAGGTAYFVMPLAVGKGVEQLEAKFTAPYSAVALPGLGWNVTMPLEARNA